MREKEDKKEEEEHCAPFFFGHAENGYSSQTFLFFLILPLRKISPRYKVARNEDSNGWLLLQNTNGLETFLFILGQN